MVKSAGRALLSLTQPQVLWHLIWPVIVSLTLWGFLLVVSWWNLSPWFNDYVQSWESALPSWLLNLGLAGFLMVISHILLALALLPIMYLTWVILLSVISLPLILPIIAQKNYPTLIRQGQAGTLQGLWNTLKATLFFLLLYGLSWLLAFIPGAPMVGHWLAIANLNRQTFTFDVLAGFASADEYRLLNEKYFTKFLLLGGGATVLVYLPLLNLISPALGALCYIHFGLSALQYEREVSHSQ